MLVSIFTGLAAGAIHVVGGVDHLMAMAPSAMKRPRGAFKEGLAWGLGHSTGVLALSMVAIFLKDFTKIERMSSWAELSVGLALIVVGGLAIRTSLGLNIHSHSHKHKDGSSHDHVHIHLRGDAKHFGHAHAATSLGILHGLAGASHFLAVLPALALPPVGAFAYMAAYLFGSVIAMGAALLAISMATVHAGRRALPLLFGFTGGLSLITGFFWLQKTSGQIF